MADLLSNLESNDPQLVEEAKLKLHEQFNGSKFNQCLCMSFRVYAQNSIVSVKEAWLVNGLYDTYLTTNSTRLMEVLVNVKEPHYTYLFDK